MTTTAKVLQVLRLFKDGRTVLRIGDVMEHLEVSCATAYRYLGDLELAGLVERTSASQYVLGSEVVELDRLIRENDPLIAAARDLMTLLAERTGGTVLLARLHGRKVMCVHEVRGRFAPPHVSYVRGRSMPLFRGATSRAILACLPVDTLRALVADEGERLQQAGLPDSLEQLQAVLAGIRQRKVCSSLGEVDPQAHGWAAPVFSRQQLLGSLSVVLWSGAPQVQGERVGDQVLRAALRLQGRLESA
jgi:DNA-binding IclR family transcriptional regulator